MRAMWEDVERRKHGHNIVYPGYPELLIQWIKPVSIDAPDHLLIPLSKLSMMLYNQKPPFTSGL